VEYEVRDLLALERPKKEEEEEAGLHQGTMLPLQGARTFCVPMPRKEQQSK
jgi:hypothetical protein